jgi:hypothetical protein
MSNFDVRAYDHHVELIPGACCSSPRGSEPRPRASLAELSRARLGPQAAWVMDYHPDLGWPQESIPCRT